MKVVAFNGSPRAKGNTAALLDIVIEELQKEGIETEIVQLGGAKIRGCTACMKCFERQDRHCAVGNDVLNSLVDKMSQADGIVIGSPTYFANVSTEVKALIDRAGLVAVANDSMLKRKVGAAVVAVRRAGANLGVGLDGQEVTNDEEGVTTMRVLGQNMAWLLKRLGAQ